MAAKLSKQLLLSRLKKVIREWPVDPSRQGRDLGEYLRTVYHKQFESLVEKDIDQALRAVESLEKLNSNYYHHLYPRVREYGFTGDMAVNNPWILSNKTMNDMNKSSQSILQRLTKRTGKFKMD